ncbi:hypothetical protein ACO0QE_004669 [Hanseniaspora vineae]
MRVLFFGSDTFSIRALNVLRKSSKKYTFDIVAPEIKKYGRNLDKLSIPSIHTYCKHYDLPFSTEVDSSVRNKINNRDYDLCCVVSYDSLIPNEILSKIPYSLNIHPSLLPKYKGSSPLQYTLLNQDEECGVTLQNLDPLRFDAGKIVTQTMPLKVKDVLAESLTELPYVFERKVRTCAMQRQDTDLFFLADPAENRLYGDKFNGFKNEMGNVGSSLFSEYLTQQMFKTNLYVDSKYKKSWARKLQKNVAQINWQTSSRSTILNDFGILKKLYTFKKQYRSKSKKQTSSTLEKHSDHQLKRTIISSLKKFDDVSRVPEVLHQAAPGSFAPLADEILGQRLLIKCIDDEYLVCDELQFESFQVEPAGKWIRNLNKRCNNKETLNDINEMRFE